MQLKTYDEMNPEQRLAFDAGKQKRTAEVLAILDERIKHIRCLPDKESSLSRTRIAELEELKTRIQELTEKDDDE